MDQTTVQRKGKMFKCKKNPFTTKQTTVRMMRTENLSTVPKRYFLLSVKKVNTNVAMFCIESSFLGQRSEDLKAAQRLVGVDWVFPKILLQMSL